MASNVCPAPLSVSWKGELQERFLQAVEELGGLRATAKPIWERMNWTQSELSVKQVHSHLRDERLKTDVGSALPSLPFPQHLIVAHSVHLTVCS